MKKWQKSAEHDYWVNMDQIFMIHVEPLGKVFSAVATLNTGTSIPLFNESKENCLKWVEEFVKN